MGEFAEQGQPEINHWARNAAIYGGLYGGLKASPYAIHPFLNRKQKLAAIALSAGLYGGLGYGVGKFMQNLAGIKNPKPKKRNWKKIALNTAGLGLVGTGALIGIKNLRNSLKPASKQIVDLKLDKKTAKYKPTNSNLKTLGLTGLGATSLYLTNRKKREN